jgi:hypothetical protein
MLFPFPLDADRRAHEKLLHLAKKERAVGRSEISRGHEGRYAK